MFDSFQVCVPTYLYIIVSLELETTYNKENLVWMRNFLLTAQVKRPDLVDLIGQDQVRKRT